MYFLLNVDKRGFTHKKYVNPSYIIIVCVDHGELRHLVMRKSFP